MGTILVESVDLADPDAPTRLVVHSSDFGGLDIFVNNVSAVAFRFDGFLAITDDQWLDTFNLSFSPLFAQFVQRSLFSLSGEAEIL